MGADAMKRNNRITPEGTKDYLFEECLLRRRIEKKLSAVFEAHCFHEVMTPGFEFYDVYDPEFSGIPPEIMFKMTDRRGRLLVMRPDNTLSIARLTATRLQNLPRPVRLYYTQPVYRNNPGLNGRNNENVQMGVELLGAGGLRPDLETVSMAVESLTGCVPGFRLELGHAGFFRTLSERLPVSEEVRENIRSAIESKNYTALAAVLDPLGDAPEVSALRALPRLFGGEEVFEKASVFCTGELRKTLDYLHGIYRSLAKFGLGDRLIVDLGLVQRNDYYTGVVFSAYVEEYGDAVLLGGRYDNLLEHFGPSMPAVGFGVNVDAIAHTLFLRSGKHPVTSADVLVHGETGHEMEALRYASGLISQGIRCESSVFETQEEAESYARAAGIGRIDLIGRTVRTIRIDRRES
jgi:ATP phosphoribosyltransferase regulatory subunit